MQTDWEVESAKMADTYANAYVCIRASSSPNSSCAFLDTPDHHNVLEQQAKGCFVASGNRDIVFMKLDAKNSPILTDRCIARNPLSERAWAFQEMVIGCRVLDFTACGLSYHCRNESRDEFGRIDLPPAQLSSETSDLYTRFALRHPFPPNPITPFSRFWPEEVKSETTKLRNSDLIRRIWHEIVERYCVLDLTNITDRLPALSGL